MGAGFLNSVSHLLEAAGITKAFAGAQALNGVDFQLESGEVHALVGENGAGKSTLIKIITGAEAADSGTLRVGGNVLTHNSPRVSRELGISAIYQQPALFPHLSVAENIAIPLEEGGVWRRVNWKARKVRAQELLERAGAPQELSRNPGRLAATLSMSEQQIVEIAKALGADARVLILDEPTASLTNLEVERLFAVIENLRSDGVGIIYISHRLEEIFAIADRITILRDGDAIGTFHKSDIDRERLIHLMVGRELSSVYPDQATTIGEVALELRKLSNSEAGLRNISLTVRRGEVVGLAGLVGSGRTELAETVFGLSTADGGEILVHGNAVRISSPADAIARRIAYVPEDRRQHGVILEMPIRANVSMANLGRVSRSGFIRARADRELASRFVGQLRIKAAGTEAETATLSGGNQQKVALARWLATEPEILILDEPTQGVDVGSKAEIHRLIRDLAAQGMAVLMISSELPEILGMGDRIAVMHSGEIRGVLTREEATQEKILELALGAES